MAGSTGSGNKNIKIKTQNQRTEEHSVNSQPVRTDRRCSRASSCSSRHSRSCSDSAGGRSKTGSSRNIRSSRSRSVLDFGDTGSSGGARTARGGFAGGGRCTRGRWATFRSCSPTEANSTGGTDATRRRASARHS